MGLRLRLKPARSPSIHMTLPRMPRTQSSVATLLLSAKLHQYLLELEIEHSGILLDTSNLKYLPSQQTPVYDVSPDKPQDRSLLYEGHSATDLGACSSQTSWPSHSGAPESTPTIFRATDEEIEG